MLIKLFALKFSAIYASMFTAAVGIIFGYCWFTIFLWSAVGWWASLLATMFAVMLITTMVILADSREFIEVVEEELKEREKRIKLEKKAEEIRQKQSPPIPTTAEKIKARINARKTNGIENEPIF